ncbi:MAG: DUF3006 domain-containing protein [Christensenellales bacterium]|jgi:hypothetical protein
MMYVIDRIDGQTAFMEDLQTQQILEVSVQYLPADAKEGDALQAKDGEWIINSEETARRQARISQKMAQLKSRSRRNQREHR